MTVTRLSVASAPIILGWQGRLFHTSAHPLAAFPALLNCSLMHSYGYCGLLKMPILLKFLLGPWFQRHPLGHCTLEKNPTPAVSSSKPPWLSQLNPAGRLSVEPKYHSRELLASFSNRGTPHTPAVFCWQVACTALDLIFDFLNTLLL